MAFMHSALDPIHVSVRSTLDLKKQETSRRCVSIGTQELPIFQNCKYHKNIWICVFF